MIYANKIRSYFQPVSVEKISHCGFILLLLFDFVHKYIQAIILESNPVFQTLNAFDLVVNCFDVKTVRT